MVINKQDNSVDKEIDELLAWNVQWCHSSSAEQV